MLRDIKFKILGLLGLLAISLALSPLSIVHAAPDVEAWERSIVRVYNNTQGGFGTGWVVSEDGIIATNHHVIAGGRDFSVYLAGSTQDDGIPARLIWSDERLDLALLRVPGFAAPPFKLHTDDPDRGTLSYTAGYPGMADAAAQGMSFRISIYSGTVSLVVNQGQTGRRIIQHDTIVNAGNSGGPLLDDCGRVLGVTSEGYADEDVNVVWLSVSISELAKQMDRLDIPYEVDNSVCEVAGGGGSGATADQEARDTAEDAASTAEDAASTAEDAQHDVESLQKTMFSWVVILVAGLAILLVLVLRKPRERVVRAIEEMSRTISRSGSRSGKAKPDKKASSQTSARNSLVLSGFSSGGKTIHIELLYEKLEAAGKGISIGRSTTLSDYALDDKEVSRRHARLSMKDGRTYIEDLNSTNGTRVNERVINPFEVREISSGDMVKIGQLELTVS
ncbi:MAG: trypsin-like peptidase domain-containing protein [Sphingomonadales bacterium]|nr:trypsin-like peptidase domain-containing protein [Sphingomonadales bacterium]